MEHKVYDLSELAFFAKYKFRQVQISSDASRLCVYQYYFPFYHWMYHSCSTSNLFKSVWGCFSLGLLLIQLL